MTRIFINGKEVKKEELCKYEIKNETAKQIFAAAIRKEREEKKYA